MTFSIRRATLDDVETIVTYNLALAWESEAKVLDEAVLRGGVIAALTDPVKGFYVMAERAGESIGMTAITYEWSDWRNGWYWWIQSVYVREDARRQGVFTAIYRHLEAEAISDPAVIGIRLYLEKDNARAQATYQALGLAVEHYSMMALYPLPGRPGHIRTKPEA